MNGRAGLSGRGGMVHDGRRGRLAGEGTPGRGGRGTGVPGGSSPAGFGGRGATNMRTPGGMVRGGGSMSSPGSAGSMGSRGSAGRHGSGRRSSSRGRVHRRRTKKSPLTQLLASSPTLSKRSPRHPSQEVASLSPAGRALDVDLMDIRSGIDSEASLSRYLESFRQQREIERQRSDFRSALDPTIGNGAFMRSGRKQMYRVARRDSSRGEGGGSSVGGGAGGSGQIGADGAAGAFGRGSVLDLEEEGIDRGVVHS